MISTARLNAPIHQVDVWTQHLGPDILAGWVGQPFVDSYRAMI